MSHLVEAGSDLFVMPSLFEPCGLNQMYSCRSTRTVPVVSRVGGLLGHGDRRRGRAPATRAPASPARPRRPACAKALIGPSCSSRRQATAHRRRAGSATSRRISAGRTPRRPSTSGSTRTRSSAGRHALLKHRQRSYAIGELAAGANRDRPWARTLAASSFATWVGGEVPSDRPEILPQLRLVARADDDAGDGGPAQQPVEGDLGYGPARLRRDEVKGVDDPCRGARRSPAGPNSRRMPCRRLTSRAAAGRAGSCRSGGPSRAGSTRRRRGPDRGRASSSSSRLHSSRPIRE